VQLARPELSPYVPVKQLTQAVAADAEYLPIEQLKHELDEAEPEEVEYLPPGQALQAEEPVFSE